MKRLFLTAAFFLAALGALTSTATPARAESYYDTDDVSLKLSLLHPKVGDKVTASLTSTLLDLNRLNISWYRNEKPVAEGIGRKQIDLGAIGAGRTEIRAVVAAEEGTIEKSVSFNPSLLSLAWQSDSSVPPFFRGKALFAKESTVTFVALPFFSRTGSSINADTPVSYTWKKDGQILADKSGFGRNTFAVKAGILDEPIRVEVTAENLETGEIGYAEASAARSEPTVAFYEDHPLFGLVLNKALGSEVPLSNPELSLFAQAFNTTASSLQWTWSMNGTVLTEKGPDITLRTQEGISGISEVKASVQNTEKALQNAVGKILLRYEAAVQSAFNSTQ